MANVIFKFGTRAQYDALITKEEHTLYWLSDTQELMKGDVCYGKGSNATQQAAGLLSSEDKKKLDELSATGVFNLVPSDASVIVGEADGNKTIGIQLSKVEGNILTIKDDGLFAKVETMPLESVIGLKERLEAVEQAVVGGVHYRGAVDTYDDLPVDAAEGDLYEVREDASEWCFNGEKWFEYGKTVDIDLSGFAGKDEVRSIAKLVNYEVSHKPYGALVNYADEEIRVMCPADTAWALQTSGAGSDPNAYYIGFKAYAPSDDVVSFKEDLAEIITDNTMYYFENNDFAGIDEYGRKYSIVWLPAAKYDEESATWIYHGDKSSEEKYIGWYYSVEWYNADGKKVAADTIRINLSNENCHANAAPYFMQKYAKVEDVQAVENAMKWQDI